MFGLMSVRVSILRYEGPLFDGVLRMTLAEFKN